jgi:hypothetical protein
MGWPLPGGGAATPSGAATPRPQMSPGRFIQPYGVARDSRKAGGEPDAEEDQDRTADVINGATRSRPA